MLNKEKLLGSLASFLIALATLPAAQAQTANAPAPTPVASTENPWQKCAAENSVSLPVRGSGQSLTSEQRLTLHSCIHTARKAAFEQCAGTSGLTKGEKPNSEQRIAIRQCMVAQGFKHHRHHRNRENS